MWYWNFAVYLQPTFRVLRSAAPRRTLYESHDILKGVYLALRPDYPNLANSNKFPNKAKGRCPLDMQKHIFCASAQGCLTYQCGFYACSFRTCGHARASDGGISKSSSSHIFFYVVAKVLRVSDPSTSLIYIRRIREL